MKTLSSRFSLTAPEWIHIRKWCKVKHYTTIKLNKAICEKNVFFFFVLLKIIVLPLHVFIPSLKTECIMYLCNHCVKIYNLHCSKYLWSYDSLTFQAGSIQLSARENTIETAIARTLFVTFAEKKRKQLRLTFPLS